MLSDDPLTRRLRSMLKDATSAIVGTLEIFTAIEAVQAPKVNLEAELKALRQQTERTAAAFTELSNVLGRLNAAKDNKAELIDIIERTSDAVMVAEQTRGLFDIDYISCAHRMLLLDEPAKAVTEMMHHPEGMERLAVWYRLIGEALHVHCNCPQDDQR